MHVGYSDGGQKLQSSFVSLFIVYSLYAGVLHVCVYQRLIQAVCKMSCLSDFQRGQIVAARLVGAIM